jgi:hypothetical protein
MGDLRDRLRDDLADRYWLERELGRGGMTSQRPVTVRCAHEPARPASHKPLGDDISLRQQFLFLERGLPPALSSGIGSPPRDLAYSTAGAFLREGGVFWGAAGRPLPDLCRNRRQLRITWDNRPEA